MRFLSCPAHRLIPYAGLVALSLLWGAPPVAAQEDHMHGGGASDPGSTHGMKTAVARRLEGEAAITIDGTIDEEAWQAAPVNRGFRQREPDEGRPSSETTEFRVLYDARTIYVAVTCRDSKPEQILARERQRDARMENDDTVAIVLDTFHDHRNSFLFVTNPLGTQHDALDTDEGRDHNVGWDAVWQVAAQVAAKSGWTAEFAIPIKSLRVAGTDAQTWGIDVERIIRRKNEFSYWNSYKRGFKRENISQGGHLRGIQGIDPGFRVRFKPFGVGGFTRESNRLRGRTGNASDAGLELLKVRLTPGLMADVIGNSNFIDTEIDNQQVNLDRWGMYYSEQREFFQESGIFAFGVAKGEMPAPDVMLFNSRQMGYYAKKVGSSYQQLTVPIRAGARVTGKVGGMNVGILDVQAEGLASEGVPESNYSVIRLKKDVLGRSAIGGFVLNRAIAGSGDYNRVYGVDSNFIFKQHFFANALYARSLQPGVTTDNWTASGSAKWDSDSMYAGLEFLVVDPNFRDDVGFVPRPDQRRISPVFDLKPRIQRISKVVRKLQAGIRIDYVTDQHYTLQTRYTHYNAQIFFQSGDHLLLAPHTRFEVVTEPFQLRKNVAIPAGEYHMKNLRVQYTVNPAKRLSGSFVFQPQWGFFGGDLYQFQIRPRIRVSQSLAVVPGFSINKATFAQGRFTDKVLNGGIEYAFNRQWLTSTSLQYNSADAVFASQFRLNYIFRPGDDLFVVYNLGRATGGARVGEMNQTLAMKLTYSFDF